eukprot:2657919-Lingulodinium_polyedra.AAC.1
MARNFPSSLGPFCRFVARSRSRSVSFVPAQDWGVLWGAGKRRLGLVHPDVIKGVAPSWSIPVPRPWRLPP